MTTDWFDGPGSTQPPNEHVAWWALLVSLVLTWVSGLDYARLAPGLLLGRPAAP